MQKRHFMCAAVTVLIMGAGSLWPVAGNAASYYGPQVGKDGQCFHSSYGVGAAGMGWWGPCERSSPSLFGERPGHGPFTHNGIPGHEGGPRVGGRKSRQKT